MYLSIIIVTRLPASLLCKFMRPVAVSDSSLTSRNFRLKRSPKRTSSEQPPHFQFLGFFWRTVLSQEQSVSSPFVQALVTAKVTPAAEIAERYAVSRLSVKMIQIQCSHLLLIRLLVGFTILTNYKRINTVFCY